MKTIQKVKSTPYSILLPCHLSHFYSFLFISSVFEVIAKLPAASLASTMTPCDMRCTALIMVMPCNARQPNLMRILPKAQRVTCQAQNLCRIIQLVFFHTTYILMHENPGGNNNV